MSTKNAKHTPGPWYHVCDSQYSSQCLRGVNHSKKAAVHGGPEKMTIASHVANWNDARLIAAAPELLAACKEAKKMLAVFHGLKFESCLSSCDICNFFRELNRLIAKAEGR